MTGYLRQGIVEIVVGLLLLLIAGYQASRLVGSAQNHAEHPNQSLPLITQGNVDPHPAAAPVVPSLPAKSVPIQAPKEMTVPTTAGSKMPPSQQPPGRHLFSTLDQLKQQLGNGMADNWISISLSDTRYPLRTREFVKTWAWPQPDYKLTGLFGSNDICYAVRYSRPGGFTDEQALTIVRTELEGEKFMRIPGKTNEVLTASGVHVWFGDGQRTITIQTPMIEQLRKTAMSELEQVKNKRIESK